MRKQKPYRIIGAYDSETTNIKIGRGTECRKCAFPILHQLGIISSRVKSLKDINASNVEDAVDMHLFRHAFELYAFLDDLAQVRRKYVPVILCHNLSFDMYGLAEWLNSHDVKVLAKSKRKPISFTVLNDAGKPILVLWDTLIFSQKPLYMMGHECGYEKLSGEWDYSLIRTPETVLSEHEIAYATHDIYALIAWMGYWCRMNAEIDESALGLRIVTKTGIIRYKRIRNFEHIKNPFMKYDIGRMWYYHNREQMPKSDDELFTMHAATRGGFTFCSSKWANRSVTPESGMTVYGYDATSQHPAQMVSRYYPVGFHETSCMNLRRAFNIVSSVKLDFILEHHAKPFPVAFYGCFEFINLRPKAGSLFEKEGIYPLASARFGATEPNEENGHSDMFNADMEAKGYRDSATNPIYHFGKLESADRCRLFITELTAWEISQAYEWDDIQAIGGYITLKFSKPTDMAVISVMQFYDAKNRFKAAMREYRDNGHISQPMRDALVSCGISQAIADDMASGALAADDMEFIYLGLKADLNGLFGIEATNEYRCDTFLSASGIQYAGDAGMANAPKNPKAWYQFGQRIVGWSRIAQICIMELCYPHCDGIVNGDTDSVKFAIRSLDEIQAIDSALERYAHALDRGKTNVCERVKRSYPSYYSSLDGIGHYVLEFKADYFCAAWNKAYCIMDDAGNFEFTLAGIPTSSSRRDIDLNRIAGAMNADGMPFEDVCRELLGYNLTISSEVTGLNARILPEWGETFMHRVEDYRGKPAMVAEPRALALFPLPKTVNSSDIAANHANMQISLRNDPDIVIEPRTLYYEKGRYMIVRSSEMRGNNHG